MTLRRADFTVKGVIENVVYIIDQNGPVSVTNDAEAVVEYINEQYPGKRIVYRDTMGQWDELKHDNGVFTGFAPVDLDTL